MSVINMDDLLDRYVNGKATAEEVKLVEAWLNTTELTDTKWQRLDQKEKNMWLSGLLTQIHADKSRNTSKVVHMPSLSRRWWNIAAVAAALVIAFSTYLLLPSGQYKGKTELTVISVPGNQLKQISLADGSTIRVNEGSRLEYPTKFDGKTREVYLTGEAYFDVVHDPSRPFIIHTGKVVTTVLGTAFNIRADDKSDAVIITVTRGKVRVSNGDQPLAILTPDQQLRFDLSNNKFTQTHVDAGAVIAWQDKDLHFDNTTLAEAVSILKQQFNTDISFANEQLKKCRFTGTAKAGEKLENILKAICAFNNAEYSKDKEGNIIIEGPGCK